MSTAHLTRQPAPRKDPTQSQGAARDLMLALDPSLGLIESFTHLTPRQPGLPTAVRAVLRGGARAVYGRGVDVDAALSGAIAAALEQQALEQMIARGGHVPATMIASGARVLVNARRFAEACSLGCAADLAAAVDHATLESCERRALPATIAAGAFAGRLDERGAPRGVAASLEWLRARGAQVTSVVVSRATPIAACVAVPPMEDHAAIVGVAAGRTCADAWQAAALELHQVFLARAPRDRQGELRYGGIAAPQGVVGSGERAPGFDREALVRALAATRGTLDVAAVAPWTRETDAVAVEITTDAARRLGRRVVAVVTGESAERHSLTLV